MAKVYKRWKIGNIGYIVGQQGLKWQQIGNTIGNNRQHFGKRGKNCRAFKPRMTAEAWPAGGALNSNYRPC